MRDREEPAWLADTLFHIDELQSLIQSFSSFGFLSKEETDASWNWNLLSRSTVCFPMRSNVYQSSSWTLDRFSSSIPVVWRRLFSFFSITQIETNGKRNAHQRPCMKAFLLQCRLCAVLWRLSAWTLRNWVILDYEEETFSREDRSLVLIRGISATAGSHIPIKAFLYIFCTQIDGKGRIIQKECVSKSEISGVFPLTHCWKGNQLKSRATSRFLLDNELLWDSTQWSVIKPSGISHLSKGKRNKASRD